MNFFDIPIINVAICIIISWALFAVLCGLVIESIAQLKAERGRFMKNYLFQQLKDIPNGINWGTLLYMHGSIDMLSRAPSKPTNDINPKIFAEAMVDIVANAGVTAMLPPVTPPFTDPLLADFYKATQGLKPSDNMRFLNQAMNSAILQGTTAAGINPNMVYEKLIDNISGWYVEMTQRMSLWYKKKTRKSLFLIGFILAVFLNVDSIQLFQLYNANPGVRTALISAYDKNNAVYRNDSTKQQRDQFIKSVDSLQKQLKLPVGYDSSVVKVLREAIDTKTCPPGPSGFWIWKIIGIIISAFAASFGGPFWFDLLKKAFSKNV